MDSALVCLTAWLPRQRWFTHTGAAPRLRLLADHRMSQGDRFADVHVFVVADDAPANPIVYQVPVVVRAHASAQPSDAVIGTGDRGATLIDGPFDPAYTTALLAHITNGAVTAAAEVLSGEQSNTSVIFHPASGSPIICKIFRQLNPGLNPDIELQSALAGADSAHVPRVVGRMDGSWASPQDAAQTLNGSWAFAQEFLPNVEDAWRVALAAAAAGTDFTASAEALGRATAEVHGDLARLFPTTDADPRAHAAVTGAWRRRLSIALDEVPALSAHHRAIESIYVAAASAPWPFLQRVHGDYHLGQVLQAPGRGWVLLDFEGEPMRPISERRAPDLALRDIAGMLRSFDYVAGSLRLSNPSAETAVNAWAQAARRSFLLGYSDAAGLEPAGALLDALELDKAVYEAIYEARFRPAWLQIPLGAIERLVAR